MRIRIPEIVALDIETTGLDPEKDRICEIALLKVKENKIDKKFITLINPEVEIPEDVSKINRIRDIDIENAPKFKEKIEEIERFINKKILLCHNANFDILFIKKEFEKAGYKFPEVRIIDTYLMAKKFFSFKKNSLQYLSKFYKLKRKREHRAEDDAKATFEIFKIFSKELERKYRLNSMNLLNHFKYQKDFLSRIIIFDINKFLNKIYPDRIILEGIEKALNEKKEILIRYKNNKKEIKERKILPLEIFEQGGLKYLKAFCYYRNAERKFRFDRIIEILNNKEKD
ncbi:MAG: exonuclease domain-containing protein [Candidatus Ratteibacteria bacterium]